MKHLKIKDKKKRFLFYKKELFFLSIKCLLFYRFLNFSFKNLILKKYLKKKLISFISITNRCIFSLRVESTYRFLKISRNTFKKFISFGFFVGIRKSSW